MRGTDQPQTAMFSYLSVEDRIPAEHPLRALRLQVLSTIRSERQLMELLKYNLRFRWVVGLNPDDAVWVPTVFRKNRDRLGRVLMDHRHGLIVATDVRAPGYDAERDAAVEMLTTREPRTRRRTSPKIFMRRNTRAPLTGGRRATRGTRSVR